MGDNNQDKYLGFTKSTYYYKKRKSQNHRPKIRQKRSTGNYQFKLANLLKTYPIKVIFHDYHRFFILVTRQSIPD